MTHKSIRSLLFVLQLTTIVIVAAFIGLLASNLIFGIVIIAVYALLTMVRRLSSRGSYILALIALVASIAALLARGGSNSLSDNFAVYSFLLLCVGTLNQGYEAKQRR